MNPFLGEGGRELAFPTGVFILCRESCKRVALGSSAMIPLIRQGPGFNVRSSLLFLDLISVLHISCLFLLFEKTFLGFMGTIHPNNWTPPSPRLIQQGQSSRMVTS